MSFRCGTMSGMEGLAESVSEWLGTDILLDAPVLNGDEAEVWVAWRSDERIIVHVSPVWRNPDDLGWCHNLASVSSRTVREAIAPVRVGGRSFTSWNSRLVAVFPFVEGAVLNRDDPVEVAAAATMLARVHQSLLRAEIGPRLPTARTGFVDLRLRDTRLDRRWKAIRERAVTGFCHGDFHRRNLLVADRRIQGVVDWHDAYVGPLIGEVAFAAWEFAHDDNFVVNASTFDLFLRTYQQSAKHLPPSDYEFVPVATKVKLRENILSALAGGASVDDEYQQMQLSAYRELTY